METRDLWLPLRPMSKERPRSFQGQSRPYMSRNYKLWQMDAIALFQEWWVNPPLKRVAAIVVTHYGAARGDVDNKTGAVMDALVKARVLHDDNVNVVDNLHSLFVKAKVKESRIHVQISWIIE